MDGIGDVISNLNMKQNDAEMFKARMESQSINNSLKKDGKDTVKAMGKDDFLKLLITELEHQDPTNPMQDREFIAQMAQFSSLEQMLSLNSTVGKFLNNMTFSSSFDLLGKDVTIQTQDKLDENGQLKVINGIVESVAKNGDETVATVNGVNYPVSSILKVDMQ